MFQAKQESREWTPIENTIASWLVYCRRLTQRTQAHYRMVILRFHRSLRIKRISQLNQQHIEEYINGLLVAGLSNRTCNAHLTAIKSFGRWLSETYGLPNPAEKIKMLKEDPPKRRFLTSDQYQKILTTCTDGQSEIKPMLLFLANTGLRSSEAASLTWDDISPDLHWLNVQKGKGRKSRTIPLNKTCRKILSHYPHQPETHIQFLKSCRQAYFSACRKISKRADIKFSPHDLRRLFANRLLWSNVSLDKISYLLGHSDIRTTELYLNHHPDVSGITDCLD